MVKMVITPRGPVFKYLDPNPVTILLLDVLAASNCGYMYVSFFFKTRMNLLVVPDFCCRGNRNDNLIFVYPVFFYFL